MSHIILEYPESCLLEPQVNEALRSVHASTTASDLFEKSHIRIRAYAFKQYTHGDEANTAPYMHIQARIKSGRDTVEKKRLSDNILQGLRNLDLPVDVITIEVVDMDRESYSKHAKN